MGPVTERELCERGGKGDWCCFWLLEVAVVGLFYKVEFTEFSQLVWKVGTTGSTKTTLQKQKTGIASHTRNGSGGSWCSVVGSVIKCCNTRIQQWGYMFKFTNTWGLHVYMQGHIKMLKCKEKAGFMLKNRETTVKTNDTRVFNPHVLRMQHRS